jgi:hypothetical protein
VAFCGLGACTFSPGPTIDAREQVDVSPAAEGGNARWVETLDVAAAPTPSGREDDPQRPNVSSLREVSLPPSPLTPPIFRKLETRHLGQWTGRPPNRVDALGFSGTDLGVAFEHRGQLWFLFGDSQSVFDYAADPLAAVRIEPLDPGTLPQLEWVQRPSALFKPIAVPGIDLGFMNVAVEGLSIDDTAYVFVAGGWSETARQHLVSALAHSDEPQLENFRLDHVVSSKRFLNVSAVREGAYVYIWGSGEFRKSDVYLARVPATALANRYAWEYFQGATAYGPTFGPGEDTAKPIVSPGCVGELSARKHPALGVYVLMYNCEMPRGVFVHTAQTPTGPYSQAIQVFEPWADRGYEHFMHVSPNVTGRDDGLSDPGREMDSGGEYGPYLVPEWFSEEPDGGHAIVYTLSSWNPYQVHLMKTVLVDADAPPPPLSAASILPVFGPTVGTLNVAMSDGAAWSGSGDGFEIDQALDGTLMLSSAGGPLGAAATGTFWHDFRIDDSVSALDFEIRGGDAEVLLVADDEVVRRARGRGDAVWRPVTFQLAAIRSRALRLALYDRASDDGGFVEIQNLRVR